MSSPTPVIPINSQPPRTLARSTFPARHTWIPLNLNQARENQVTGANAVSPPVDTSSPTFPAPVQPQPTEYLETPAAGNVPPSTDPGAYIDPATGNVVAPTPVMSVTNTITSWVQQNPLLALFVAGVLVYFGMEMFGKGGGGRWRK